MFLSHIILQELDLITFAFSFAHLHTHRHVKHWEWKKQNKLPLNALCHFCIWFICWTAGRLLCACVFLSSSYQALQKKVSFTFLPVGLQHSCITQQNIIRNFCELFCISSLLLWKKKEHWKIKNCSKVRKRTLQWFGILEQKISLLNRIQFTGDKESMDSDFSYSECSADIAKSSWNESVLPLKRLCCHTVEKNIYSI